MVCFYILRRGQTDFFSSFTAIYGYNFCESAKKAFLLIVANALRVAAINSIGDFVLFLGKISTAAVVLVIGHELFFKVSYKLFEFQC